MKRILCLMLAALLAVLCCSCTPKERSVSKSNPPSPGVTVRFINVGQGDCTLIESAGEYMLVDAGERDYCEDVIAYMSERGVKRLTYAVATHPHSDHIGGMGSILSEFGADNFITAETDSDSYAWTHLLRTVLDQKINYIEAKVGSTYTLGNAEFTVLAPNGSGYDGYNNSSVVLMLRCGETRFLLTGDAEQQSEYEMIDAGAALRADVLKCGHHGSSDASSSMFLKAVDPAYAVISCGKGNAYGHPHHTTLKRLSMLGAEPLRTDLLGTITAISDGRMITFTAQNSTDEIRYISSEKRTTPDALNLIGNLNSGLFHDPTCIGMQDMREENRTLFATRQEALDQGYTPCPQCKP